MAWPEQGAPLLHDQIDAMWSRARPAMVGIVVIVSVLIYIRQQFAAMVPPWQLNLWLGFMGVSVLFLCGSIAAFCVERWRAALPARFWVGTTRIVTLSFCGGIAASVWLLLPAASNELRLFMVVLYMWFIAMVMMADGSSLTAACAIGLIVSLVAFALVYQIAYAVELAVFLTMAGVAIVSIRSLIWRAANEAHTARALTERAGEALTAALDLVSEERDAKTRFIASASHDLQQPIQAASLYFDRTLVETDPARRERAIAGARSALTSTQALLQTMLDYLRLDAGAVIARMETIAIDDIIGAVALEHDAAAAAAGMRIRLVRCTLEAAADAQLLQRTLGNLLANAVRHAKGEHILIGARRSGSRLRIWVIDDGAGILPADRDKLFEDYRQGSDHGPGGRGGFGLGLSSARRMVALMGGSIDLDPRWTGGAAFFVELGDCRRRATAPEKQACLAS